MLASKRGFLCITLTQAALHGLLVRRNPAVQHVAFRQIEFVYRVFHGKAHGAMVLGAQVVRLEKSPVPFRGRVNGIEMRLAEALPRETARAGKQREIHFRIVVEPIFRSARRAVDSLLGDSARMFEALLQQRVRIRQAAPRGTLLPKSALLPALDANGRPMSAAASFGVVGSGVGSGVGRGARGSSVDSNIGCIARGNISVGHDGGSGVGSGARGSNGDIDCGASGNIGCVARGNVDGAPSSSSPMDSRAIIDCAFFTSGVILIYYAASMRPLAAASGAAPIAFSIDGPTFIGPATFGGNSTFIGIAAFVVTMAFVGIMPIFGKLILRHDSTFPRGPFILTAHCNLHRKSNAEQNLLNARSV